MKRRNFSSGFKAKVALAAMRVDRTIPELAAEYGVHPVVISKWKKQLLDSASIVFEDGRKKSSENDCEAEKLYEEIGRLKMQLEWVKKKSGIIC